MSEPQLFVEDKITQPALSNTAVQNLCDEGMQPQATNHFR